MSGARLNAYLIVLLVAVSVHSSYGEKEEKDGDAKTCTTNSECDYDNGYCLKFDQCDKGWCWCKHGLFLHGNVCKKVKKSGESCDKKTDLCIESKCTDNVCTCQEDKLFCGSLAAGDSCDDDNRCGAFLTCQSNKCECSSDKKPYKLTALGLTLLICVNIDANIHVKAGGTCDYVTNICDSGLFCTFCPGQNSTMCMSGASQLSISLLALCGLFVTAMLTKF